MLDSVRSFSEIVFESLPSRIRMAAAPQSAVPGHRTVWSAAFRTMTLWDARYRWMPQPLLLLTSLSAT